MGIFVDIIEEKSKLIGTEMLRLLDFAWERQNYIGDLLLFHVNGFFNKELVPFNENLKKRFNPYVVGPGAEGHSEQEEMKYDGEWFKINAPPGGSDNQEDLPDQGRKGDAGL